MEIKRKPVPPPTPEYGAQRPLTPNPPPPYPPYRAYSPVSPSPASPHSPLPPPLPPRLPSPSPSYTPYRPPHNLPRYRSQPNLRSPPLLEPHPPPIPRAETTFPADPLASAPTDPDPSAQTQTQEQTPSESKSSSFSADARYFLSGLIHHPSESTRHYSILRHSHGIVFYRGPTTSVTVSLFSSSPLPPTRKLYLQCKGWSGKTGMRAKALFGMHDDWVDATPTLPAPVDQIDPQKERAWQRDFTRFYKKASKRVKETHVLRETAVARIPPDAEDGYFQLILCDGDSEGKKKKVLCRSPVFRILSTSFDPSSLRGASLSTMPLELGALVAGTYAQIAASKVLAPATAAASAAHAKYKPGAVGQAALRTAYGAVKPDRSRPDMAVAPAVENGPLDPYPLEFGAKPLQSIDHARVTVKVPSDVLDKLRGYFFGWARFKSGSEKGKEKEKDKEKENSNWQMVILSLRLWDGSNTTENTPVSLSQTTRKIAVLRFVDPYYQLPSQPPPTTVRLLGFLHHDIVPPPTRIEPERQAAAEAAMLAEHYDTEYTQALLDHPLWGPESTDRRGWLDKTRTGAETVMTKGQKMVERVGVRSGVEAEPGGGFYIVRDGTS